MIAHRLTIFEVQTERLGGTLVLSVLTHVLLIFTFFLLPNLVRSTPESWGDSTGGGAMSVGIVSNVTGLSLPRPELTTDTTVASELKGLGQTEVQKTLMKPLEIPDPKAFQVEDKKSKESKKIQKPAAKAPPQIAKYEPPKEVVPYGEGGNPNFSYSQFSGSSGTGGIGVGNGIFGQKYGWYVRQIRDIVSSNWLQSMVDTNVRSAPKVFIQFEIQRDGSVAGEFVKQSSGIPSLDRSGLRAIRASRFPPLPGGETRLTVEFYFEYSK
jgi:protein TonB